MSAAKFTPGSWQINHRDKLQICDSDGIDRGCSPIAHCVGDSAVANARLIAAAPDLLAALIEALAYVPPRSLVSKQIRSAIAQAVRP